MLQCPDSSPLSTRELPITSPCNLHAGASWAASLPPTQPLPLCPQAALAPSAACSPCDCCHRDILLSLQARLMCSFFNKTSAEKLHCAGSLYSTDFSSISPSSLIFKNVSNCYCTVQGIDGWLLPLFPFQYFKIVKKIKNWWFNLNQSKLFLGAEWPCLPRFQVLKLNQDNEN